MDDKDVSLAKDASYRSIKRSYPWAAIYAEKERANLELGKVPLKNLRDILEEKRDIQVFFLGLPDSISGMFAFGENIGGSILINDSHPFGRQLFSLAHEYAHYLFDREKMGCVTEESKANTTEERFANRFSADFLMPREAIREMFELRLKNREPTAEDIIYLADYFGVSFQAMIYRLGDLRLIKRELRDRLPKETWIHAVRKEMGQPEPEQKQTKLPRRYIYLCILAYLQKKITTAKFADLLEIPLYKAMNIAKKIKGVKDESI
ncbi:ImmA/IrrE family metallo-endopeptidase [Patescibacteria group bacterium]|nr:ImmA/IrrE family metallo-endopeptidase [Patescibacteria group bacterium]